MFSFVHRSWTEATPSCSQGDPRAGRCLVLLQAIEQEGDAEDDVDEEEDEDDEDGVDEEEVRLQSILAVLGVDMCSLHFCVPIPVKLLYLCVYTLSFLFSVLILLLYACWCENGCRRQRKRLTNSF